MKLSIPVENTYSNSFNSTTSTSKNSQSPFYPQRRLRSEPRYIQRIPIRADRLRPGQFLPTDEEMQRRGCIPREMQTFRYLCKRMRNETKRCWPHQATMCVYLKISEATLQRHIAHLELVGLIVTERPDRRFGNCYTILDWTLTNEVSEPSQMRAPIGTLFPSELPSYGAKNAPSEANSYAAKNAATELGSVVADAPPSHACSTHTLRQKSKPPKTYWQQLHRRRRPVGPVGEAAKKIMKECKSCSTDWPLRTAIMSSVETWMDKNPGKSLDAAVVWLVNIWTKYKNAEQLKFRFSMAKFFGENHWEDPGAWPWDLVAMRRRGEIPFVADERENEVSYAAWDRLNSEYRRAESATDKVKMAEIQARIDVLKAALLGK